MKMFSLNTLNSQNEMNNMEKKIYSRPTISETRLDSEINLVLMSPGSESGACYDNSVPPVQINCTTGLPLFLDPFKWLK